MSTKKRGSTVEPFKVPVSCVAEFIGSPNRSVASLLRPYKFNKRGEGAGRSGYYRFALNAIRRYHHNGGEPKILDDAISELRHRAEEAKETRDRVKYEKNIVAVELYRRVYRNRKFKVLPNHRIAYRLGGVVITAQPDLWVEEDGTQVLLKVGMSRKNPSYVDVLLTIIRKAAVSSGYRRVRAKNVVYLNVTTGREMISRGGLTRFNNTFKSIAREIAKAWPVVTVQEGDFNDSSEVQPTA